MITSDVQRKHYACTAFLFVFVKYMHIGYVF